MFWEEEWARFAMFVSWAAVWKSDGRFALPGLRFGSSESIICVNDERIGRA